MNTQLKVFIISKEVNPFEGKDYAKLNIALPNGKIGSVSCPLDLDAKPFERKDATLNLEFTISNKKLAVRAVGLEAAK